MLIRVLIQRAETGEDKKETYQEMMSKHKLAMKNGFFLEALLIDYAVIEDRLIAFLWAAGVVRDKNVYPPKLGNKRNKDALKILYYSYIKDEKSRSQILLKNLTCKITWLRCLIDFTENMYDGDDGFLKALYKGMKDLDLDRMKMVLDDFEEWKNYRNEIIHGVMNKNIYSLYENLEEKAKEGLGYARIIDNEARKLRRRQYIRKAANMSL